MSEQGSSQKNAALSDRESGTDLVRETNKPLVNYVERLGLLQKLKFKASNRMQDFSGVLGHDFRYETGRGLAFNLVPVFLAVGIMIYFHVPAEPLIFVVLLSAIVVAAIAALIKVHGTLYYGLAATATILFGMMAAQFSVLSSDTVQIERQVTSEVAGLVLGLDSNRRGAPRLLLKPYSIDGIDPENLPDKIRLSTTAKNVWFEPGTYVRGLARLQPMAGPVFPDSYDFSFFAWFSGLGGSGFFMGQPEIIAETPGYNWHAGVSIFINRLRTGINKRIVEAIPGDGGDVAVALITGDKSRIPKNIQTSLRNTGLAHILAISGLHMALVTLTLIWLIRLGFSFFPTIVLHYPVKKWAVCVGFIAATLYLLISGFGVATQRAWIMISVMLLAVLLDRRAITMRSVAVSATLILLINPQNLFSPGFQMSFAAVASLVAGYEFLRTRKFNRAENRIQDVNEGWKDKFVNGPYRYISGLVTTSLIAGTATSFVAAWHFHQVAPYGLLANVLAMPIVGTIIMPSALFSMLLMPYGMEKLALVPVEFGIGLVVQVSMWVESISPAGRTGILPENSLLLFGFSLAALTLFKTRLRLLGLAVIPMMYFFWEVPKSPQVLVSENGRAIAVSDEEGQFGLLYPRRNRFVTDIWAKAWSSGGTMKKLNLSKDQCNSERCMVVLPSSLVMHIVYDPKLIRSSCQRADILIAPRLWWVNCRQRQPRLVLKRYDFEQRGSKAIYITQNKTTPNNRYEITVRNGLPDSKRPWARKVRPIDEISDTAG